MRWVLWGAAAGLLVVALTLLAAPAQAANYTINGDWVIGPSEFVSNVSDNITVFGDVIVQGMLSLQNCTLNVTYLPSPPPPQIARLGHVIVTGQLTVINTTVTFDVGLGGSLTVPNGFRVSSSGRVTIRDYDNIPSTPGDASYVRATQAGTYSTFAPGADIAIWNSYYDDAGWDGYPGLALNGTTFYANQVNFANRPTNMPGTFGGITVVRARNNVSGSLGNSTFNATAAPAMVDVMALDVQASPGLYLNGLNIDGFRRGVVWANDAGVYMYNLTFIGHGTGVEFSNMTNSSIWGTTTGGAAGYPSGPGWPPAGTLVAIRQSQNIWVTETRGNAGLAVGGFLSPTLIAVLASQDVHIPSVDSNLAARFGAVEGSTRVWVNNVTASGLLDGLVVSNSDSLWIDNVTLSGPGARLEVSGARFVWILNTHFDQPTGLAIFVNASFNVTLEATSANAEAGIYVRGSANLSLVDVALNVTQSAVSIFNTGFVDIVRLSVTGTGSGLTISNVFQMRLQDATIEHAARGIDAYDLRGALLDGAAMRSPQGVEASEVVHVRYSQGVTLRNLSFSGNCTTFGKIQNTDIVAVERLSVSGCQRGLEFESDNFVTARNVTIVGTWNGTGLRLDTVTDVLLENIRVDGAADLGLSVSLAVRLQATSINVTASGAAGAIFSACTDLDLSDSEFSTSGGTGLLLLSNYEPVQLSGLALRGNDNGLRLLSTKNATVTQVEASNNAGDGVFLDSDSTNVLLRDLKLIGNGRNGLLVDATGAALIDGNISANDWDGIAAGRGIRLSWLVEVAASFTDGSARLPGDLTILPGARFWLVRATLRPDATPISARPTAWNVWSFGEASTVFFEGATVDPVNRSAAYAIEFASGSSVSIRGSDFVGAGRDDARSRVAAADSSLEIMFSTFTGFHSPLVVTGGTLRFVDTLFFDNKDGLSATGTTLAVSNLTVQDADGDGIVFTGGGLSSGDRIQVRDNAGVGLRLARLLSADLSGLVATGNAQGGVLVDSTPFRADGVLLSGNVGFALSIAGTETAEIYNYTASLNAGPGLRVSNAAGLTLGDCLIDRAGGYGIELDGVGLANIWRCTVEGSGGFGLTANDVDDLTMFNVTFDGNSVSHIELRGSTHADIASCRLRNSPGDAVHIRDSVRLRLVDCVSETSVAGILALEDAYAYLLNATFGSAARALGNAQVDIAWRVQVHVALEAGGAIPSALVNVTGADGTPLGSASTNDTGWTRVMEVLERTVYGTGEPAVYTPHLFEAMLPSGGYVSKEQSIEADSDVVILADDRAPTTSATLDGPEGKDGWHIGPVTVSLEAEDASGGFLTLWWRTLPDPATWDSIGGSGGVASTSFEVSAQGDTDVEYYAIDAAGNRDETQSVAFRIDSLAPSASLEDHDAVISSKETDVAWFGTDAGGSGIVSWRLEFQTRGGPWTELLNNTNATTYHLVGQEGLHTFRLQGTDAAGLTSPPASMSFEISLYGTLRIHAVDAAGVDVPGIVVFVGETNESHLVTGNFTLSLPPGEYTVIVSAPGYSSATLHAVVLAGGETDPGPLTMDRYGVSATVADAPPVAFLLVFLGLLAGVVWFFGRRRMGPRLGTL